MALLTLTIFVHCTTFASHLFVTQLSIVTLRCHLRYTVLLLPIIPIFEYHSRPTLSDKSYSDCNHDYTFANTRIA